MFRVPFWYVPKLSTDVVALGPGCLAVDNSSSIRSRSVMFRVLWRYAPKVVTDLARRPRCLAVDGLLFSIVPCHVPCSMTDARKLVTHLALGPGCPAVDELLFPIVPCHVRIPCPIAVSAVCLPRLIPS